MVRGGQSAPLRNTLATHQHPQDPPNCGQQQGTGGVVVHELHIGLQCLVTRVVSADRCVTNGSKHTQLSMCPLRGRQR